jgi:hypothetical protein
MSVRGKRSPAVEMGRVERRALASRLARREEPRKGWRKTSAEARKMSMSSSHPS